MAFVHLHNHTTYSLLDGAASIDKLIDKAVELGMPAIAITDHGTMYGVIDFFKKAKKSGIKPIIGCEVYVAPKTRFDRDNRKDDSAYHHLILLAENQVGYQNLCKLVSLGFLEGFYYKPRVDKGLLTKYAEGLIVLSGCIAGQIPRMILDGNKEGAKKLAAEYQCIFGKDNYFIEIQNHGMEEELTVNPVMVEIAQELDIPIVATNDIHYVNRSDTAIHDILLCIQTGHLREEENRMRFPCDEFYLKSEEEMRDLFPQWPQALSNTLSIAERCNIDFKFGDLYLPDYEVPQGFTLHSYLEYLCQQGLPKRYLDVSLEIKERLTFELDIIQKMGFSGYFLIVWDMIHYARSQGISVGPGRGSAAGSIVAYLLEITNIDPIRYDLLFERFLNPERISPPDIDIDICDERRGEVVDYLFNKYGYDKVSQIITFNVMLAKGAIRDVGRVLNMPYADVDDVVKLIPTDPKFKLKEMDASHSPELWQAYQSNPTVHELIDIAREIEGMPRHAGKHAAGVVIAKDELISYMPVQKTADGIVTTQYEKQQVEDCGLLKMDLLGLRTLSVLDYAVENIRRTHGIEIDINQIPIDDAKTFDMLGKGNAVCVFQLESEGMRKILRDLKPERFEDIIALVALYRPGPLGSGMVESFIQAKHGKIKVEYKHPLLEDILKETYGVILYQEQVMRIASRLAGFSLGQSDMLRRAMGKKKPEIIAKERSHFVEGCKKNQINAKVAGEIFDLMEYFAGYGFNKSHSAAYALVSYDTAWLKANYPPEFMASMLTTVMDTADKVPEYIEECNRMGITVLPPDINESSLKFSVVDGKIRFALSAVKNVGRDAVRKIEEERESNGPFQSLSDLCCRVMLNKRMLESLIKCGALDRFGHTRAAMLDIIDRALDLGKRYLKEQESQQLDLFSFGMELQEKVPVLQMPDLREFSSVEMLNMEKEIIGFYVSGHPLDAYQSYFSKHSVLSVEQLTEREPGEHIRVGLSIASVQNRLTKNGKTMSIVYGEDQTGSVKVVVFPKSYDKCYDCLNSGRVVVVEGNLKAENGRIELLAESMTPPCKLYLRLPSSKDQQMVSQIRTYLADYPGSVALSLYYQDLGQYFPLAGIAYVAYDSRMFEMLSDWLGEENVVIR